MTRLTPVEEQVMLKVWQLGKCTVKEINDLYEKSKPAYNTTSTIVRILERKKFIKHKAVGRGFIYMPNVPKEKYRAFLLDHLVANYAEGNKAEVRALLD